MLLVRPHSTPRRRGPHGASGQQPHPWAQHHAGRGATSLRQRSTAPAPRSGRRQRSHRRRRRWVASPPPRPSVADAPRGTHTWQDRRLRPQPRPCRLHTSTHPATGRRQLHSTGLDRGAHALLFRPPAPCDPQRLLRRRARGRGRGVPAGAAALRPHSATATRCDASWCCSSCCWWWLRCWLFRTCRAHSSGRGRCQEQPGRWPGRDGGGAVEPYAWSCAWGGRRRRRWN